MIEKKTMQGGQWQTRQMFLLPQERPFQGRDFHQTRYIPQMFCGGTEGYTKQVQVENNLREIHTRPRDRDHIHVYRDCDIDPLIIPWQQDDYRPLHFVENTRTYEPEMISYSTRI